MIDKHFIQGKGGSFIEICYRYLSAQKRVAWAKISLNEQLDQPAGKLFQALEELVSFACNYLGQSLCSFYLTRWRCLWQISIFVAWIALEIGNCRVNRKEKMRPGARYWCTRLGISHRLALMNLLKLRSHPYLARS